MKTSTLRIFIQRKSWIKLSGRWNIGKNNLHCVKLIKENYLEKWTESRNLSTDMGRKNYPGKYKDAQLKKKKKRWRRDRERNGILLNNYSVCQIRKCCIHWIMGRNESSCNADKNVEWWKFRIYTLCYCLIIQSCLSLYDPMDCSPPGSSVYEISQARILEWVAMPSSRSPGNFSLSNLSVWKGKKIGHWKTNSPGQ